MNNLEGRVIVVTGGSGGIGIVASELMAERGAHVVLAELDGDRADIEAKDSQTRDSKQPQSKQTSLTKNLSEPWLRRCLADLEELTVW